MISWLLLNLKEIGVLTFGIFSFLLLRSNRRLKEQNKILDEQLQDNTKIIDIQAKVIDVTENTKPSDFDGNIKRMQDGKL
jgi:preprotein translocase subunit YajC